MEERGAPLRPRGAALLALPPLAFLGVLFAWPLGAILLRGVDLGVLADLVTDPGLRRVAWFTVWQACASTAAAFAVGLPLAWVVARLEFPGRRLLLALATVPFVLPTLVVGIAYLALLPDGVERSAWAIVLAHATMNAIVVVRLVGALWAQVDPRYVEAARTLGASPARAALHVALPLLRPALGAAAAIVLLFCATSFGVVLVLGGPARATIEVEIYRRTVQLLDLDGAAALAVAQLAALGLVLIAYAVAERRAGARRLRAVDVPRRQPRGRGERLAVAAALLGTALVVGGPLGALVWRSLGERDGGIGLDAYRALADAATRSALLVSPLDALATSLAFATVAAAIATAVGVLGAVTVARGPRLVRPLDPLMMLPLATSAATVGLGVLIALDRPPVDLRDTWIAVPLAHALIGTPFVLRGVLAALRAPDPRLREAAATLGASPWRTLAAVDLPLARRAIVAGASLAFAVSLGDFGVAAFLVRPDAPTLPTLIGRLLARPTPDAFAQALAASVLLMAATAAAAGLAEAARGRESRGAL